MSRTKELASLLIVTILILPFIDHSHSYTDSFLYGSGKVMGMTQRVGDLSAGQCQDCVTEAIRRLKGECGTGVYGDVFLAKCYARYSTNGARFFSKGNDGGKSGDRGTKTFAIIVGLLGGVALLIIFLIFMRKVFHGGGK